MIGFFQTGYQITKDPIIKELTTNVSLQLSNISKEEDIRRGVSPETPVTNGIKSVSVEDAIKELIVLNNQLKCDNVQRGNFQS